MTTRKPLTKAQTNYDAVVDVVAIATAVVVVFSTAIHFASGHALWVNWAVWGTGAIAITLIVAVDTEVKWRKREDAAKRFFARIVGN